MSKTQIKWGVTINTIIRKLIEDEPLPDPNSYIIKTECGVDLIPSKGILNILHTAMVEQYGTDTLLPSYHSMEDDYAVIPGVIQGKKNGEVAIALLGIDLASSGEHCQTDILCRYGIVSQGSSELPPQIMAQINAAYMPYDYGYIANIPDDIHIDKHRIPDGIKAMLDDFQHHTAELFNFGLDENIEKDMER